MKNTRVEADSIGVLEVPETAYYGVQTLRAKQNFKITNQPLHPEFIKSIAKIKKAAAITNCNAGKLSINHTSLIIKACDEIIEGKLMKEFIVDAIQGGAGTSANMNANEVIANRAIELMDGRKGDYSIIHPNDHVNMAQSTNDVIPSAGKLTVLQLMKDTITALSFLQAAMLEKSIEFNHVLKMGRTQLQDAVPMKLGQAFHAYASVIERDIERLKDVQKYMRVLNMGGTAIGTGINVPSAYLKNICRNISSVAEENFEQAEDLFDATQNVDGFVTVSGVIKTCAVNLSKICNDLRLLSSGPRTGFNEINLPAMQNGSSIMPGKVNPVIPEVVSQVAFHIVGCDASITMAAEAGQMELNAFEPVIFYNLFEAIETLGNGAETLTNNCILGITANEERCNELVNASVGISTALCPYIGYKKSAAIAKESLKTGISVKELVIQKQFLTPKEVAEILNPEVMIQAQRYEMAK